MSKVFVQIRGCNGSGKSTIPMLMLKDPKKYEIGVGVNGTAPYITVFPAYKWAALGRYKTACGGMDGYKNNAATVTAINYALLNLDDYDILCEGVIASTVYSTWLDAFGWMKLSMREDKILDREIIVMNFLPPLEVCLERIQERNGGKEVDEKAVGSKWRTVERNHEKFKQAGITSIRINTSKVAKADMLKAFNKTVDKYRR